jgi:hypothetical protein
VVALPLADRGTRNPRVPLVRRTGGRAAEALLPRTRGAGFHQKPPRRSMIESVQTLCDACAYVPLSLKEGKEHGAFFLFGLFWVLFFAFWYTFGKRRD